MRARRWLDEPLDYTGTNRDGERMGKIVSEQSVARDVHCGDNKLFRQIAFLGDLRDGMTF